MRVRVSFSFLLILEPTRHAHYAGPAGVGRTESSYGSGAFGSVRAEFWVGLRAWGGTILLGVKASRSSPTSTEDQLGESNWVSSSNDLNTFRAAVASILPQNESCIPTARRPHPHRPHRWTFVRFVGSSTVSYL